MARMTKKSIQTFKRWQARHPNIMTPEVIALRTKRNTMIEVSKGRGMKNENIYGVTKLKRYGNKYKTHGGKMFYSKKKAMHYAAVLNRKSKLRKRTMSWFK
jgi:hypothetical protein